MTAMLTNKIFEQISLLFLCTCILRGVRGDSGWESFNQPTVPSSCTQIILTDDVPLTFTSPGNYPTDYPDSVDRCWLVRSNRPDVKPKIKVVFSSIEALIIMGCEAADFIEIRDGSAINGTLIMRWCGWGVPLTVFEPVISDDSLYVFFHTDTSVSFGGFEMMAYLNESVLSLYTTTKAPATPAPAPAPGVTVPPGAATNQPSTLPNTAPTTDAGLAQRFMDDQKSLQEFNRALQASLNERTLLDTSSSGILAAIVIGVLAGTAILGIGIHCATKACMTTTDPSSDLRNGNVVIPGRRQQSQFFDLGNGLSNRTGKTHNKKYNLPPPEVNVEVADISDGRQHLLAPANASVTPRGSPDFPQGHTNPSYSGPTAPAVSLSVNQSGHTDPSYSGPTAPTVSLSVNQSGHTNPNYSGPTAPSLGLSGNQSVPRSALAPMPHIPRQTPGSTMEQVSSTPYSSALPSVHQNMNQYSRSMMDHAFRPDSMPSARGQSRSPIVPPLQLDSTSTDSATATTAPPGTTPKAIPSIITPRLTSRTMITTTTADQAETHLADVVDTDETIPDSTTDSGAPPLNSALTLSPRLPPLLAPIRTGALPPLDLAFLDGRNPPPPPSYRSIDGPSGSLSPPPYESPKN